MNQGFGLKWKNLFLDLEMFHGLIPGDSDHIWLLQHHFMHEIAQDAEQWRRVWNVHTMQLMGQRNESPESMWRWGMIQHGICDLTNHTQIEPQDENVDNPELYGIDWEALNDDDLMEQFLTAHPEDYQDTETVSTAPRRFSIVNVDDVNCPLTDIAVEALDGTLQMAGLLGTGQRDLLHYRACWDAALALLRNALR